MIPNDVKKILEKINENGFEAYIVGGAVRDFVLNETPHDWDIATSATPEQIKNIFAKTIDTGLQHGTVTAMMNNVGYEITTFRIDGDYSDGRHPDEVKFTTNIIEDLARRDFTINAMAMDKDCNIIDPFNGQEDLKNNIIKAVGNPDDRIKEDALRMMRAVRFSAKLGFLLDEELYNAIKRNSSLIQNISAERIEAELTKIITSNYPEKIMDLYYLGLTKHFMPEFDRMVGCEQNSKWHIYDVAKHTVESMKSIDNDKILRWTMLMHDIGKPVVKCVGKDGYDHFYGHAVESNDIAVSIMKRLKFSNNDISKISKLIKDHDLNLKKLPKIRMYAATHTMEHIENLRKVQMADMSAQSDYEKEQKEEKSINMYNDLIKCIEDKSAITLKDLKINGHVLMDIGFKNKQIGEVLNFLHHEAICRPEINEEKTLINMAKAYYMRIEKNKEER